MPNETIFPETLRTARTACRLTLLQLGQSCGVSAGYVCDMEQGRRTPSPQTIERLAVALHIDRELLYAAACVVPPELLAYLVQSPAAQAQLRALMARETDTAGLRAVRDLVGGVG